MVVVPSPMPVALALWVVMENPAAWLAPAASRVTIESVFFMVVRVLWLAWGGG